MQKLRRVIETQYEATKQGLIYVSKTNYLHDLRTVKAVSNALSNNLSRLDKILKDALMHGSKGPASWTLDCGALPWRPHDSSGGNDDNILGEYRILE